MTPFLTNVLTSLLVGALSAWITTILALRRFRSEQLWIRKMDAYAALFEALIDIQSYSQAAVHELESHHTMSQTVESQLSVKASRGHETIRKAIAVGALVLSAETAKHLEILQVNFSDPLYNLDVFEEMTEVVTKATKAIADLRVLAKDDLTR